MMMARNMATFRTLAVAIMLTFACPTAASAQDTVRFMERELPDEVVEQVLASVVANLHLARGDDGQPLPPLSEAERATPLLDRALVREVTDIGVASGIGQVCGLDWQTNNFLPLMRRERQRGDRTPHQIAAIAMVHGVMQAQVSRSGACGSNGSSGAAAFYERKWRAPPSQ